MENLAKFIPKEGADNVNIQRVFNQETNGVDFKAEQIENDFEAKSVRSQQSYNWSAVGEMNMGELDKLETYNAKR